MATGCDKAKLLLWLEKKRKVQVLDSHNPLQGLASRSKDVLLVSWPVAITKGLEEATGGAYFGSWFQRDFCSSQQRDMVLGEFH